jgi:hypothetical protein
MWTEVPNHEPSLFMFNTGAIQPGRPSLGSWLMYGLGSENRDLPGFVVLCPGMPVVGSPLWSSAFLPAVFQGTFLKNTETDPHKLIRDIQPRAPRDSQRRQVDLLAALNREDILVHKRLAAQSDAALASLIEDLQARDMLRDTLVVFGTEFGRTPAVENGSTTKLHFGRGYRILLAGGGIKSGTVYGATDDFGYRAAVNPVHPHDVNATLLHLLGLDHTRLTYHYSGRDFRLTDVHGNVLRDILA